MYKINKHELQKVIANEERYRNAELETRFNSYCLMSMCKDGATIASFQRGLEFGKQFKTDIPKEKIEKAIKDIKGSIKYSKWKEKFYRYAYNKDYDNMKKYSDKCFEYESKELEDIMDTGGEGYAVNIDYSISGEENVVGSSENGILLIADQYKKFFEVRKDLLEIVKK
jgi:hypothetical protein|tara:strand:+ start:261 stop:767 length:507 start_codon:yes stop_codon:yes gene_type:complete